MQKSLLSQNKALRETGGKGLAQGGPEELPNWHLQPSFHPALKVQLPLRCNKAAVLSPSNNNKQREAEQAFKAADSAETI